MTVASVAAAAECFEVAVTESAVAAVAYSLSAC